MTLSAGLSVSDKATHIYVVDGEGAVGRRDVVASDPDELAKWLARHCKGLIRVVLETGPFSGNRSRWHKASRLARSEFGKAYTGQISGPGRKDLQARWQAIDQLTRRHHCRWQVCDQGKTLPCKI